jgi:hypothetical protein
MNIHGRKKLFLIFFAHHSDLLNYYGLPSFINNESIKL